jgi:hypothetical protein
MTFRTFEEWSRLGWRVKAGAIAARVNGLCLFSREQVERPEWHETKKETVNRLAASSGISRGFRWRENRADMFAEQLSEAFGEDGLDGNPADYGDN